MRTIKRILRLFKPKPKQLTAFDILKVMGKTIIVGGESQLVTNGKFEETEDGYIIQIFTVKGDWDKDLYPEAIK